MKLNKIQKAHGDADRVIEMKPDWEKGYFRKASVYESQGQYEEALEWYKKAAEHMTAGKDIEYKIKSLNRLIKSKKTKISESANKTSERG